MAYIRYLELFCLTKSKFPLMAASVSFKLSPSVLEWARTSMGYSIDEAANKSGVSFDKYKAWETGIALPTYRQLENLAQNVFKRPLAILLLSKPPIEESIQKDFRTLSNAQINDLAPNTRLALRRAKRYQLILEEVAAGSTPKSFKNFKTHVSDNPEIASGNFREFLGLTLAEQQSWKPDDAFRYFQKYIEGIGIYVFKIKMLMQQARAFCLTGEYPIVVLNLEDSNNGRIFSLFHEVCHIILNTNDIFRDQNTGQLSNEYREVEDFCNKFAASFLVPQDAFLQDVRLNSITKESLTNSIIGKLSKSYNVSNEVIARKFLALNLLSEKTFWEHKYMWDFNAVQARKKANQKMSESESAGINQGIKILYEKGVPYVTSVINAYQNSRISASDLSNFLETKLENLPKIKDRLTNK